MTVSTRYQHAGFVLFRASTDPGDLDVPTHLDLGDQDIVAQNGRAWLTKMWARPEVREALALASPALGARLEQLLGDGTQRPVKHWRGALISVTSYLLRWQRRATPFGLFAGVGVVQIGHASADVGTGHQAVLRADGEWLTTLTDQLEQHPGVRPRLTVVADNARVVRDGRVIVHHRGKLSATTPGPLRESSVRFTRPVEFALNTARSPITFSTLAAGMTDQFPRASSDTIRTMLDGMVDAGLLITNLRPPPTTVDTLSHLVEALRNAGGAALADIAAVLQELDGIRAQLVRHNLTEDRGRAAEIRATLVPRMRALAAAPGPTLAADTRLDARVTVPERVLTEAEVAASVLLRVTTQPFGSTAWLDYHARFLRRYGPGALVPVQDLVADSGLGYPAGYLGAPRARPAWRTLTERDATLLALIQRATVNRAEDIDLSAADIAALTVGEHTSVVAPHRIELGVALSAPSTEALDRGDFHLRVTAAPRVPTSMAGRFAYLLDEADRARLAATYVAESNGSAPEDVIAVQLSFPPRRPHNENVVRVPALLPEATSISEHGNRSMIDVDDLAVTADAEQMYLVRRSTGQRVIPTVPHALDLTVQSPPLARFLAEVADARSATFRGFDLGAARALPYVPRIRYRRTVLSPARWILSTTDLADQSEDDGALRSWRRQWQVPTRVVLVHGELRLPLDLDHILDCSLLRTHLNRHGRLELHEDGPPEGDGWIGRPTELLIPLMRKTFCPRPLPATTAPGSALRPGDSAVVHAQLIGNPARFDDILTSHLPGFVEHLGDLIESWWIRRHRNMIRPDDDHYLDVFLRLNTPDHYGLVATSVAGLAADLERQGLPSELVLASAPQHLARYGHGPALSAAEQVFATDTTAAIAQIIAARTFGLPAQALGAASMAQLAASFAADPQTGYRALLRCLPQEHGPLDRALRDRTVDLADPDEGYRAIRALPGGQALTAAWECRATALTEYHRTLTQQQRDPATVLRTLLHEHHMRAVGVDPAFEKETGRLARAAALHRLAVMGKR